MTYLGEGPGVPYRRWMAVLAIVALMFGTLLAGSYRSNQSDRTNCESGSRGAEAAGAALQSIIDGNEAVAKDPFQSKTTQDARQKENVKLAAAVAFYRERAARDCNAAYPWPF